jgi:hypothetical protein
VAVAIINDADPPIKVPWLAVVPQNQAQFALESRQGQVGAINATGSMVQNCGQFHWQVEASFVRQKHEQRLSTDAASGAAVPPHIVGGSAGGVSTGGQVIAPVVASQRQLRFGTLDILQVNSLHDQQN